MGLCHAKSLFSEEQLLGRNSFSNETAAPFLIFATTAGSQNVLFHFFPSLWFLQSGASVGGTSVSF